VINGGKTEVSSIKITIPEKYVPKKSEKIILTGGTLCKFMLHPEK
jgi:hypothetical protein